MIILISWPLLAFLAGFWVVIAVIGSILYGIQNSWSDEKVAWLRPFTVKQKWGLFALLLGIFGSVAAVICGFIYHKGLVTLLGCCGWIITSLWAANSCSPMKMVFSGEGEAIGCGPLASVSIVASTVLIMAFSWIFVLIAIFRKSTWRLLVGILLAVLVFFACVFGVLTMQENRALKARYTAAENLVTEKDFDAAAEIYKNLGEEELYWKTRYDGAVWAWEQGEYYDATQRFAALDAEHPGTDAQEQIRKIYYQWGQEAEAAGNYVSAANSYSDILDYLDAKERYQYCCYMEASQITQMYYGSWDNYVQWYEKAGDYEDAPQLAIYYRALIAANEDLASAEELLRRLPRDYKDVDVMLTALETYRDWNGSYTLKESKGKDPELYTGANLVLVYKLYSNQDPQLEWKVDLTKGNRSNSHYSEGAMPEKGTLKFKSGVEDSFWYDFVITKKRIKLDYQRIASYGSSETTFVFEKAQ